MKLEEQIKNVDIDGIQFQIMLMPALTAAVLDRKIIGMLAPTVGGIVKEGGLDAELNLDAILNNLSDGLMKLDDDEMKKLLIDMLSYVSCVVPGQGVESLNNESAINKVFAKKILSIYKLIIQVMQHNGFSVFGLVGDGLGMSGIFSFGEANEKEKNSGQQLEKSEN